MTAGHSALHTLLGQVAQVGAQDVQKLGVVGTGEGDVKIAAMSVVLRVGGQEVIVVSLCHVTVTDHQGAAAAGVVVGVRPGAGRLVYCAALTHVTVRLTAGGVRLRGTGLVRLWGTGLRVVTGLTVVAAHHRGNTGGVGGEGGGGHHHHVLVIVITVTT